MATRSFALFASLTLAFALGCSGSSGATPVGDAGTDTGGDAHAPDPETNEAFFEAVAEPLCARIYHCCATTEDRASVLVFLGLDEVPADAASCTTAMKTSLAGFAGMIASSFTSGRLGFVPAEAGACLATLKAATDTCEGLVVNGAPGDFLACPKAYVPKVAIGGDCIMSAECVDSVCQPTDETRTKAKCQPRGKEGDTCLGDSCETGLVCSELVEGACVGSTKSHVCRKPGAKGARCCSSDDCAGGDCVATGDGEPRCVPPLPSTPVPDACKGP